MRRMFRLPSLARRNDGVTAIEFAIIAPILFMIFFAIIEFSMIYFVQGTLEAATNFSARLGKTGYVDPNTDSQLQTVMNKLAQSSAGLIDISKVTVTTTTYEEFGGMNGGADGGSGLGAPHEIVVYNISYPWHVLTPVLSNFVGDDGIITISSRTVVKNEPYGD